MRFIVIARLPTEAGNKIMKEPNAIEVFENIVNNMKAEAAYFSEDKGERTVYFVVDLPSAGMLPSVAEPLFQLGARVEMHPAFVLDELKKAVQRLKAR